MKLWQGKYLLALTLVALASSPSWAAKNQPKLPDPIPIQLGLYDNASGSPVLDMINGADRSIDLEIYEMDDPQVIDALRAALKRGVRVHIVKEAKPVGATCKVFEATTKADYESGGSGAASCATQKRLVREVNSKGGIYVPFARDVFCDANNLSTNCLEHGKLMIVDAQVALISSGNFNTTNLCDLEYSPRTCNRDFSFVTDEQDVVTALRTVVEKDLSAHAYDVGSIVKGALAEKLTVGPNSLAPIAAFLKSAKKKIQIENQYLKEPTINKILTDAARKGIQVEVMIASACAFGKPTATEAQKLSALFKGFDAAGIKTRMFNKNMQINGKEGYLHAKAVLIDDDRAWVGSVNGSTQALTQNREFGLFFDDSYNVRKLGEILDGDFYNDNAETWRQGIDCAENN